MKKVKLILENDKEMEIELYEDIAPISVDNFLKLVNEGYYDGIIFHRIIKGFMAQAGGYLFNDQKMELIEKEDRDTIKGEFLSNGINNPLKHEKGVISMARTSVKDSASTQFFICTENAPHLDNEYAAFGKVVKGFDTLDYLDNVNTEYVSPAFSDFPYPIVRIKTIKQL